MLFLPPKTVVETTNQIYFLNECEVMPVSREGEEKNRDTQVFLKYTSGERKKNISNN